MKKPKNNIFLIDWSSLKSIIEGSKVGQEILNKLVKQDQDGKPILILTTINQVLGATYHSDPKSNIQNLQKVLNVVEIVPAIMKNFKSQDELREEIINIATKVSELQGVGK